MNWTDEQEALLGLPLNRKTMVRGPAGTGKTTVSVGRARQLMESGVSAGSILVLAPQRTLHGPYRPLQAPLMARPGTQITLATIGGLARRMCDLFWPLVNPRRFADSSRPPFFLTLESAQYYMAYLVRPLIDQGYFGSVTMDRNRLYGQILDSLNKAAAVGFPHTEIGSRLARAWAGDPAQRRVYEDAQECAIRFRSFCLEHNLLDFSLQLEVFWEDLWPQAPVREYFLSAIRHVIYENAEEDVPRAHDWIRTWLPEVQSAIIIVDSFGGFRQFLGADPNTALELSSLCDENLIFSQSLVSSPPIQALERAFSSRVQRAVGAQDLASGKDQGAETLEALGLVSRRFFPEVLDAVAEDIDTLVRTNQVRASAIAVVAPYVSDALRFSIGNRLDARNISWETHRPSRPLGDEASTKALMTIAAIAHPLWEETPHRLDVTRAFMVCLGMDLVRARLLTDIVYHPSKLDLSDFDRIKEDKRRRITEAFGLSYTILRQWVLAYREATPLSLDAFFRRLFGEVLSQPGFPMHTNLASARLVGMLVESIQKFRLAREPAAIGEEHGSLDVGREYSNVLREGLLPAQYYWSWERNQDAVLLAPAHSYLLMNRSSDVQYWLDPGSEGWFQRLDQPLTHIRVLSRHWPAGHKWTSEDEEQANLEGMSRVVVGLLRRCSRKVVLCISEIGETGFEQRGHLLMTLQAILQHETTRR
jgi:hypothetical protein